MGLDSIELLMEIEKYFGIQIPDAEAEKIYTVQEMVDAVAVHLNISDKSLDIRDRVFQKVTESIPDKHLMLHGFNFTDLIANYIFPEDGHRWNSFKNNLGMNVPKPEIAQEYGNKGIDKIKKYFTWVPYYDWSKLTVGEFIDAICACNYLDLLNKERITSQYEIYMAVVGITVEKIGVDFYEVTPDKSFTKDLGVD